MAQTAREMIEQRRERRDLARRRLARVLVIGIEAAAPVGDALLDERHKIAEVDALGVEREPPARRDDDLEGFGGGRGGAACRTAPTAASEWGATRPAGGGGRSRDER
jgi:hypothetical protein